MIFCIEQLELSLNVLLLKFEVNHFHFAYDDLPHFGHDLKTTLQRKRTWIEAKSLGWDGDQFEAGLAKNVRNIANYTKNDEDHYGKPSEIYIPKLKEIEMPSPIIMKNGTWKIGKYVFKPTHKLAQLRKMQSSDINNKTRSSL